MGCNSNEVGLGLGPRLRPPPLPSQQRKWREKEISRVEFRKVLIWQLERIGERKREGRGKGRKKEYMLERQKQRGRKRKRKRESEWKTREKCRKKE
jgi:hypothetical protein